MEPKSFGTTCSEGFGTMCNFGQCVNPKQMISAGNNHTCGISFQALRYSCSPLPGGLSICGWVESGGEAQCWGSNTYGKLGDGTTENKSSPTTVSGLEPGARAIATGVNHTCAITAEGAAVCWGRNNYGQLGIGSTDTKQTPTQVSGLTSGVRAITAGDYHSCAITSTGAVRCWGLGTSGELGNGASNSSNIPVATSVVTSGVQAIAAGASHTCAITSANAVRCWGKGDYGALGNNNGGASNSPVQVLLPAGATPTEISAGDGYACASRYARDTYCWGNNANGQLGNGETSHSLVPVKADVSLVWLEDYTHSISCGTAHACVLQRMVTADHLWCWGSNASATFGNGNTTSSTKPIRVDLPTTVFPSAAKDLVMSRGSSHVCALSVADKRLACWGNNGSGRLGDGTTTNRQTPVRILGF